MSATTLEINPEAAILCAALSGYGDLGDILGRVEVGDFYAPWHGTVWDAVGRVYADGRQPTMMTVSAKLDQLGVKHDPIALHDLAGLNVLTAHADWYADQVILASGKRRLVDAAYRLNQLGTSGADNLEILREEARAAVDAATTGRAVTEARGLAQVLPNVLEVAQHGRAKALDTGWPDVDRLIGGLAPGRLVVVGARPGVGKSLMGTCLALHFAHHHAHAVLFASLEMDAEEVTQRVLANHAKVQLTGLMEGKTTDAEWETIARLNQEVVDLPLRILDDPGQTVTSIRREARNYQRTRPDLALIVVDYLQLMGTRERKGVSRAEALGEVSRGLKMLARETGACVVAMAQVNRESVRHSDGKPRVSDLRESGSIEADADQVILLHPGETEGDLEVLVDKNRHGPKGQAVLRLYGHYARLANVAWTPSRGAA